MMLCSSSRFRIGGELFFWLLLSLGFKLRCDLLWNDRVSSRDG